jgi:putative flavoprotein involved in K+ transport
MAAQDVIDTVVTELNKAFLEGDVAGVAQLFTENGFWRDLLAFTWNLKTVQGPESIADMLTGCLPHVSPVSFTRATESVPAIVEGVDEAILSVETRLGRGSGHIRVRDGKIVTLLTTLNELKGHEEPQGQSRSLGAEHGIRRDRKTWHEKLQSEADALGYKIQPFCLVIGGGQGGIALGARLRQLNVPTIVIDRHERPGDNWRSRYKSLCLHDPVWYDHLPYIPFPENWPVFSPKEKIADWLEMYTKIMEVNYWASTECVSALFNEHTEDWTVTLRRKGEEVVVKPKHIVLATGLAGKPRVPVFAGQEQFRGEVHHSSQHPGPDNYTGKRVVVIGANNSAHDICAALWEAGADVTMVQRSSTHIVKSGQSVGIGDCALYSQDAVDRGITTQKADLLDASVPFAMLPDLETPVWNKIREQEKAYYDRLKDVGFELDFGDDGSGTLLKYYRKASGYYIDVGASELIMNGDIKLVSGKNVARFNEHGLVMEGGSELAADLVVLATGYHSMNGWVADLISKEVADKVGKVWGYGSATKGDPGPLEGELRNMWKPTQQAGLWLQGGNLHQTRYYSQFLALQLKARFEGIETPVYQLQPVHHTT